MQRGAPHGAVGAMVGGRHFERGVDVAEAGADTQDEAGEEVAAAGVDERGGAARVGDVAAQQLEADAGGSQKA